MGKRISIEIGSRYGRLVVAEFSGKKDRNFMWLCRCDCGNYSRVSGSQLKSGGTKSCGCSAIEARRENARNINLSHGMSRSPEYRIWKLMRARCTNPKASHYENYGGRGIAYCSRWNSFENFYLDMGARPSPRHSLDRYPDINGNYEPKNCRWATQDQQMRNIRTNHWVLVGDVPMILVDAARALNVSPAAICKWVKQGRILTLGNRRPDQARD